MYHGSQRFSGLNRAHPTQGTPVTRSVRAFTVRAYKPAMHGRRRSHRENDEFGESAGEPPPKQLTTSSWDSSRSLNDAKSYHVEL